MTSKGQAPGQGQSGKRQAPCSRLQALGWVMLGPRCGCHIKRAIGERGPQGSLVADNSSFSARSPYRWQRPRAGGPHPLTVPLLHTELTTPPSSSRTARET
jgi:hypothetical protein